MIDALARPQSVLLLGGTSAIGLAVLDALPPERLRRVVLAVRDTAAGEQHAKVLRERLPGCEVTATAFDATRTDGHAALVDGVFDAGDVDVVVLAVGALGEQARAEQDPAHAVDVAAASYTGPLSLMLHAARRLRAQGHGVLVVLSSVAAVQARPANFVYGSAKAGLDHAARGVTDLLHGSGATVLLVRPGFVRTAMTAHLPAPPLAVGPEAVGRAVAGALAGPSRVLYVPGAARVVAAVLRSAPRRVLRALPF